MTDHDTIELDPDALNHALDVGNAASAAGLDNQAQAVEIIKAYLAYTRTVGVEIDEGGWD